MARATSKTFSYDVQSTVTGETRTVIERTFIKSTRVAGGYVTAQKHYALFDTRGHRFERTSDNVVVCLQTGERFHVIGQADHIRKSG